MIENKNLNEENSQKEAYKIPTVGEILLRFEEETGGIKGLCTARVIFFWISLNSVLLKFNVFHPVLSFSL